MQIALDIRCLQSRQHAIDGHRLDGIFSHFEKYFGAPPRFLYPKPLDAQQLADIQVLILTTRIVPLDIGESQTLLGFVDRGGGLLIMSNHGDWPGVVDHDCTSYDRTVTQLFGVTLICSWFHTRGLKGSGLTTISGAELNSKHPILATLDVNGSPVESVVTNNCSAVSSLTGESLVRLPNSMVDERTGLAPASYSFAHALVYGQGRVVTMADSGFIGTLGSARPGPGLLNQGSNLHFLENTVKWLGGEIS